MVIELALIEVKAGMEQQFQAGVAAAKPLFLASPGCHEVKLLRSEEYPQRFRLLVTWETVEDHTLIFRQSPAYAAWRSLVSDCFASPPMVEHQTYVSSV